jgi:hypothetical protein
MIHEVSVKIGVVKEVFKLKKAEIEANRKALANKAKRQKILRIIDDKRDQELSEKSVDELMEMYDDLE